MNASAGHRPFLLDLPFFAAAAACLGTLGAGWQSLAGQDTAGGFQFVFLGAIGLVLARLVQPADRDPFPLWLFLLAYSGACLLALLSPGTVGGDDESFVQRSVGFAEGVLTDWKQEDFGAVTYAGYVYLLGYLQAMNHHLGGFSTSALKFLNAGAGALLCVITHHLAEAVFADRVLARRCGLAAAGFPLLTYFSVVLYRDIVLALLIAYPIYLFALQLRRRMARAPFGRRDLYQGAALLLSCWSILAYRDLSLFLLLLSFGLAVFAGLSGKRRLGALLVAAPLIYLGVTMIPIASHGNTNLVYVITLKMLAYGEWGVDRAGQGSLGARVMDMPMAYGWFPRLVYTLFFPVPPIITRLRLDALGAAATFGSLLSYFYIPFFLAGCWMTRRVSLARVLFWPGFVFLVSIALTSINVRHKTQFFVLYVIMAVFAWTRMTAQARGNVLFYYSLLLFAGGCAYAAIKTLG